MDAHTPFLVDECLSTELARVIKDEYGFQQVQHVTWIGKPPARQKSWKDYSLVNRISTDDLVFVTNNRKDFVKRFYPQGLDIHNGLIIIIEVDDLDHEVKLFRAVLDEIVKLPDLVNKLVEVNREGVITISDWPDHSTPSPWADPTGS